MRRRYYSSRRYRPASALSTLQLVVVAVAALALFGFVQLSQMSFAAQVLAGILVVAAVFAGIGVLWFIWKRQWLRWRALQIADIDNMTGFEFERYLIEVLKDRGYSQVEQTAASGDFGVDILYSEGSIRYAAQVKRYKGLVGIEALYQSTGGRDFYKANQAVVITNSYFTVAAQTMATRANIQLIDRDELIEWVVEFQTRLEKQKQPQELL